MEIFFAILLATVVGSAAIADVRVSRKRAELLRTLAPDLGGRIIDHELEVEVDGVLLRLSEEQTQWTVARPLSGADAQVLLAMSQRLKEHAREGFEVHQFDRAVHLSAASDDAEAIREGLEICRQARLLDVLGDGALRRCVGLDYAPASGWFFRRKPPHVFCRFPALVTVGPSAVDGRMVTTARLHESTLRVSRTSVADACTRDQVPRAAAAVAEMREELLLEPFGRGVRLVWPEIEHEPAHLLAAVRFLQALVEPEKRGVYR